MQTTEECSTLGAMSLIQGALNGRAFVADAHVTVLQKNTACMTREDCVTMLTDVFSDGNRSYYNNSEAQNRLVVH
jgi:hypothetical protein